MRKRKKLLDLASIFFYFNEALKGIVFQLELNAFFILKSEGGIIKSKNRLFVIFNFALIWLKVIKVNEAKYRSFLGIWAMSYRDIKSTSY